jgi:hypothetical protein
VLDPADRIFEVLFALLMVLGFTGSLSVWSSARPWISRRVYEVRATTAATGSLGVPGPHSSWKPAFSMISHTALG